MLLGECGKSGLKDRDQHDQANPFHKRQSIQRGVNATLFSFQSSAQEKAA